MARLRVHGFAISVDGYGAGPHQDLQHPLGVGGFGTWRGWWGDEPPYHTPVFVLTSYPRAPVVMKGGTVFHFVTDGIRAALEQAVTAAGGQDVRLGGGGSTIRQYLQAALVDEMHLAIAPVLLGSGEHLMAGLDLPALGYACTHQAASEKATHVIMTRRT